MLLLLDPVVANGCLLDDMLFKFMKLILKEGSEPFSDNDEFVKELVLTVVELVICLLFVAIEDLNQRCSEVPVLNLVNGLDGVVIESSHDVSVLMELLEDLVFVLIKFTASVFVFLEEERLQLLHEELLGNIEEALLGTDDLLVIELVVIGHGGLILEPLFGLALVELGCGIKDDLLEFLELGEDLRLDLVVIVGSLVSIELLGEI